MRERTWLFPAMRWGALFLVLAGCVQAESLRDFVSSSSVRRAEHAPICAVDGDRTTRWSSDTAQAEEWLEIDLGRIVPIERIEIVWEYACAVEYTVQVSLDGVSWEDVYHQNEGKGGTEVLSGLGARGRFLRFVFLRSNYTHLYSIWELRLGNEAAAEALNARVDAVKAEEHRVFEEQRAHLRPILAREGIEDIIFVTRELYEDIHWYANFSYYAGDPAHETYVKGAGLYRLHVPTGEVFPLLLDPEGTLRDPAVHYDGSTILFSWRKGGETSFHLYTIQGDGTGLRQVTSGDYDDIEPAWLPDGGIVFVSSRSRRWVNCWFTQVATVYRCDAEGGHIEALSANLEQDNTPWPMPDGRVLYTRWEYIDRNQVEYHHLWTMNPDGSNQMVYFGNMHPGGLFIDAKPIPGTDEVVTINSPLHGKREHEGYIALVSAAQGPDKKSAMRNIAEGTFTDPFPIMKDLIMAAQKDAIAVVHRDGQVERLYILDGALPQSRIHEPRPLIARPLERRIPVRTDPAESTGRLVLSDAYTGRHMAGVERGCAKRLLIVEALPKPINYGGGMEPITYGGSFSLERLLGTVPVEEDGSAYFEVPANRSLFFILQDANGDSIKRMQSFVSVMPGETTGCVGCHEVRTRSVSNPGHPALQALLREPSVIEPIASVPSLFDFPRDIQPILDKHCLPCHDYVRHDGKGPRAGGVILSGDRGPVYSHSYMSLTVYGQITDGRNLAKSNLPPWSIGAVASPLMNKVSGGHHGVSLTKQEIDFIRYWIETGAPYPGTYAAMGSGAIGGQFELSQLEPDGDWPESMAAQAVMEARCISCHQESRALPTHLSDDFYLPPDVRMKDNFQYLRSRHFVFNLSRPDLSLVLLSPLSASEGGYESCGTPVFASKEDPGYQAILAMCLAGKHRLETIKRFDMAGFRPPEPYIREMKRYGVLPADLSETDPVDPYATDWAYWASLVQGVSLPAEYR